MGAWYAAGALHGAGREGFGRDQWFSISEYRQVGPYGGAPVCGRGRVREGRPRFWAAGEDFWGSVRGTPWRKHPDTNPCALWPRSVWGCLAAPGFAERYGCWALPLDAGFPAFFWETTLSRSRASGCQPFAPPLVRCGFTAAAPPPGAPVSYPARPAWPRPSSGRAGCAKRPAAKGSTLVALACASALRTL